MKKTKLNFPSFIRPKFGEASVRCSKCNHNDFMVFVQPMGEFTAKITEMTCTRCVSTTKVEEGGVLDRRGKFINERSIRVLK